MFKRLDQKLPESVARRLNESLFAAPSSVLLSELGLILSAPIFWWRSQDAWLRTFVLAAILLGLGWIAVLHFLKQINRHADKPYLPMHWLLANAVGGALSVNLAVIFIQAVHLGEITSIELAMMSIAAHAVCIITRTSAVPRVAIPQLVLLVAPLAAVAILEPDAASVLIALLLMAFGLAGIQIILDVHCRMKAEFVAEYKLSLLARTDYLTGLPNRASFDVEGSLRLEQARAGRREYALALIDLDGFKVVNDTHGHGVGDALLKAAGERMTALLHDGQLVARLGGDEFALIFRPGTEIDDVVTLGDQIVDSLNTPFEFGDITLRVSASVGIGWLEGPDDTLPAIVRRADHALYQAKNAGKNQVKTLMRSPGIVPAAGGLSAEADLPPTASSGAPEGQTATSRQTAHRAT